MEPTKDVVRGLKRPPVARWNPEFNQADEAPVSTGPLRICAFAKASIWLLAIEQSLHPRPLRDRIAGLAYRLRACVFAKNVGKSEIPNGRVVGS
jgi:hypothetical protein